MELLMKNSISRFSTLSRGVSTLLFGCLVFISCKMDNKKSNGGIIINTNLTDTTASALLLERANSYLQTNFDSVYHYALQAQVSAKQAGYVKGVVRARAVVRGVIHSV